MGSFTIGVWHATCGLWTALTGSWGNPDKTNACVDAVVSGNSKAYSAEFNKVYPPFPPCLLDEPRANREEAEGDARGQEYIAEQPQ